MSNQKKKSIFKLSSSVKKFVFVWPERGRRRSFKNRINIKYIKGEYTGIWQ